MKPVATASLAYGYYLGNTDGWDVEQANRLGALNLDWYSDVADGSSPHSAFIAAATAHLTHHDAMRGLSLLVFGDLTYRDATEGYVFLAVEDSRRATERWGDSLQVTPQGLLSSELAEWDSRLAEALSVLGLTPHQDEPEWQILASLS